MALIVNVFTLKLHVLKAFHLFNSKKKEKKENLSFKLYSINLSFSLEHFPPYKKKKPTTVHVFAGFLLLFAKKIYIFSLYFQSTKNRKKKKFYINFVENFLKRRCQEKTVKRKIKKLIYFLMKQFCI